MKIGEESLNSLVQKSRLLGINIETMELEDNSIYYIIHKSDLEHTIIIPEKVKCIGDTHERHLLKGNIKVIGGAGLISTKAMFSSSMASTIDISDLYTGNVVDMSLMFEDCSANIIGIENLDTSNVKDMSWMFEHYGNTSGVELDLTTFNTEKVTSMHYMFSLCEVNFIDLSSFTTKRAKNINGMFFRYYGRIKTTNRNILKQYKIGSQE